jgi:transcriptional regulator with XRE-family HTH domain
LEYGWWSGMSTLSRNALGGAIQRARVRIGLTQGQLGELTGLGQPLISRIEAGTRKIDLVELLRVAAALDVKVDDLLNEALAGSAGLVQDGEATPELIALRLADAETSVRAALRWVPDFLQRLRRLEQLDADAQR